MPKNPQAFPFNATEWLDNTFIFDMGLECEGAYCRLLAAMWKLGGSVPDSPDWICNVLRVRPAKWRKIRAVLTADSSIIFEKDGQLFNDRLTKELQIAKDRSDKNAKSAIKRWKKNTGTVSKKPNKNKETTNANAVQTQCDGSTGRAGKGTRDTFSPPEWMILDLWKAYLKSRRQKKHPMNSESLALCVKAIEKTMGAGIDLERILTKMIESGWRSCKPEWFQGEGFVTASGAVDHARNAQALVEKLTGERAPKVVN